MNQIMQVIALIFIFYIVAQVIYTGHFFLKSKDLVKVTYVGERNLGDTKNPEMKILIDGDSVGAGVGALSFERSLGGRIAEYYAKNHYVKFINNSKSGNQMKDMINTTLPAEKQDLTVLVISSNDLFRFEDLSKFNTATDQVIKRYSKNTDKLIIIGPGRVFDTGVLPFFIKPIYKAIAPKYAEIIAESAKKHSNVVYISPLNASVDRKSYGATDATDGFHPNDEGHKFWFDLLLPAISR